MKRLEGKKMSRRVLASWTAERQQMARLRYPEDINALPEEEERLWRWHVYIYM